MNPRIIRFCALQVTLMMVISGLAIFPAITQDAAAAPDFNFWGMSSDKDPCLPVTADGESTEDCWASTYDESIAWHFPSRPPNPPADCSDYVGINGESEIDGSFYDYTILDDVPAGWGDPKHWVITIIDGQIQGSPGEDWRNYTCGLGLMSDGPGEYFYFEDGKPENKVN